MFSLIQCLKIFTHYVGNSVQGKFCIILLIKNLMFVHGVTLKNSHLIRCWQHGRKRRANIFEATKCFLIKQTFHIQPTDSPEDWQNLWGRGQWNITQLRHILLVIRYSSFNALLLCTLFAQILMAASQNWI